MFKNSSKCCLLTFNLIDTWAILPFINPYVDIAAFKAFQKHNSFSDHELHGLIGHVVRKNMVKERIMEKLLEFADEYAK